MIRLLLILLLIAAPAAALELTYQADQTGQLLVDDAALYLIDENGIPALAASVTRMVPRSAEGLINPIPPGTEFDVCDSSPLTPPVLKSSTPFLFTGGPEWTAPFWIVAGKPWKTKLELIRYDDGNTDYQGFTFEADFLTSGPAPVPVNVMTEVVETTVNGVTTTTQSDSTFWHMTILPFGTTLATRYPLRADWKTYYDPCTDPAHRPYGLELCRYQYGQFPVETSGDETNGVKRWVFQRTELYDVAGYYNSIIPVPATVTATPGFLEISLTAEQTAEIANWHGSLQLAVLYPEFVGEEIPGIDQREVTYSRNYLNPLPVIVTP